MEDEKFKDLLEDEELKLLRLAALATKQKKQQLSDNTEDSGALPINRIITPSASGSENASNQFPFVQSERNAFNNTYSWRKQNHSLRRRGGAFPKSNQRSNLIVINPIVPNEGKGVSKNVAALMLPQHKWCNSGNEDSMSPKTLRKTGPTRFNRHGSDSESSDSEFEKDMDSGSNETVLQDEPPEHFSQLSSDSDVVPENVEKKRRLSFQNLDSDIQSDAFDKSETTSIYNVLKNPSNSLPETFVSVQNSSDIRQAWNHSLEEEYESYKRNNNEHHHRDASDNFVQKQVNSSVVAVNNGESHAKANRVQPSDNLYYSSGSSSYPKETAYNVDHRSVKFGDKRLEILPKEDLRHEIKKHMKKMESNSSGNDNQNERINEKGSLQSTVWNRNQLENVCSESAGVSYSNTYENEQEFSNISRNRNRQNFGQEKDGYHTSLSHGRHQHSLSAERNKQAICSDKDVSNFDYSSGPERNSRYDQSSVNDRNRPERSSSRDRCEMSLNRNWYTRSTSRGRQERSCSRSRHERSCSRSRYEQSSRRSRREHSSSRNRQERSSSRNRHERSLSRSRHERSLSRSRHDSNFNKSRHQRSTSRNRHEYSSSRNRHDRSSSRVRYDRSSSRTRNNRSFSRSRRDRSFSRSRHDRSSSRSERGYRSRRNRNKRSSSKSSYERSSSRSRSRQENSSSRDVWKNERNVNEGGIKLDNFHPLKNNDGRSSPIGIKEEYSFREEKNKHSLDEDKSKHEYNVSQDKNIIEYNSSQNRIRSEKSSSPHKSNLGYISNLHDTHGNKHTNRQEFSVKSRLGNKGSGDCQDGKDEQINNFEKRKHSSSSVEESVDKQVLNENEITDKQTLQITSMYSKSSQRITTLYNALNQDKKAACTSKEEQQCTQLKKPEKNNKINKSSRKDKSKSVDQNYSNINKSKIKAKGQKSSRRGNSRSQYSRSRSSSCTSSSSSYSSSSYSSKPKIRSISSVIKSVQPNDTQNKQSSCEIKSFGKKITLNTSQSDASSKKNIYGDQNKLSTVKSSRIDLEFKACDNSKRVPVHMRLGVLPRKRVIQMPKDVEAAFVNSSSSSDGENVNAKCKRQNIRIVTDVTDAKQVFDYEKHHSEKEKSPKRSSPDLNQEKSKRLKIKR